MPGEGGGDLKIKVDPAQFKALLAEIKEFDPKLARALRKQLRAIGGEIVNAMQAEVNSAPSRRGGNTRSKIAAGLGVRIASGKKRQGISITGSSSKLAPWKRAMPRVLNKASFRHPVFDADSKWVRQRGHPYFGVTIKRFEAQAETAVEAALAEAIKTVRTGTPK